MCDSKTKCGSGDEILNVEGMLIEVVLGWRKIFGSQGFPHSTDPDFIVTFLSFLLASWCLVTIKHSHCFSHVDAWTSTLSNVDWPPCYILA